MTKVWPSSATKLVARNAGGGFVMPGPAGSKCGRGAATFLVKTTRTLSASQVAKIDEAMSSVKISKRDVCGADKPFLTLDVTANGTTQTLSDEFYSCRGGDATYVTNIDGVLSAFRSITE